MLLKKFFIININIPEVPWTFSDSFDGEIAYVNIGFKVVDKSINNNNNNDNNNNINIKDILKLL